MKCCSILYHLDTDTVLATALVVQVRDQTTEAQLGCYACGISFQPQSFKHTVFGAWTGASIGDKLDRDDGIQQSLPVDG